MHLTKRMLYYDGVDGVSMQIMILLLLELLYKKKDAEEKKFG